MVPDKVVSNSSRPQPRKNLPKKTLVAKPEQSPAQEVTTNNVEAIGIVSGISCLCGVSRPEWNSHMDNILPGDISMPFGIANKLCGIVFGTKHRFPNQLDPWATARTRDLQIMSNSVIWHVSCMTGTELTLTFLRCCRVKRPRGPRGVCRQPSWKCSCTLQSDGHTRTASRKLRMSSGVLQPHGGPCSDGCLSN